MCIGLTEENRLLHFNTYHIMMPVFDTYAMCVEVLKNLARNMQHMPCVHIKPGHICTFDFITLRTHNSTMCKL